jgi:ribosomal protein S18 acetylase RimI-like enzyme
MSSNARADVPFSFVEMQVQHAAAVGRLHATNIEESSTSALGADFVGLLYECMLKTGYGVGYVMIDEENEVAGFSFGRTAHRLSIGGVVLRSWRRFLRPIAKLALTRPVTLFRAVRGAMQAADVECGPGIAEAMTLTVTERARGGAASRKVFEMLWGLMKREGCQKVRWVTLQSNVRAQRYYEKIGARVVKEVLVAGTVNLVYEKDLT